MLGNPIGCSVVIPTADRGSLLINCLDSVFAQTVFPSEIIVVDNGDCDAVIPREYLLRITLIRSAAKIGPGKARNLGAMATANEFVSFLDDDDVWHPEYIEHVLLCFERNNADAVVGQLMRRGEAGCVKAYKLMPAGAREQRQIFYCNPGFGGQNLTIRRDVFLAFGGFDECMPASEDRDLAARLLLDGKRVVPEPKAIAILCDHQGPRARQSLLKGNWAFIKKHWRNMRVVELYLALKVLLKRYVLLLMGR